MEKKDSSEFYTSFKISTTFKIFLLILIIFALGIIGYLLHIQGAGWQSIIKLTLGVIFGLAIIYWFMTKGLKRFRNLSNLSDSERFYVNDLSRFKLTLLIKKYVFSDMDIQNVLSFLIIIGNLLKWLLFYIFVIGSIVVLCRDDTFFNKMMILSLTITWCPWVENALLRKVNYKIVFMFKLLITIIIFFAGITASP
ncbi:MAG: hypothetical protein ABIH40_02915 [Candidatus Omnitrophota bacterium]